MSYGIYPNKQLRAWDEEEIELREHAIRVLHSTVMRALQHNANNKAWTDHRFECPVLMPVDSLSYGYSRDDVFVIENKNGNKTSMMLRPETTNGSYLAAQCLRDVGKDKIPFVVWQAGLSFRTEQNDGANFSKMRLQQFWQLEFQCFYNPTSHADYKFHVMNAVEFEIGMLLGAQTRIVKSDRLPAYSQETDDIEALVHGRWMEMASISKRNDASLDQDTVENLEVSIGLDRLVLGRQGQFGSTIKN